MVAQEFIVGYVVLWLAWSALVGAVTGRRGESAVALDLGRCVSILACALVPVVALSLAAYYAQGIPTPVNEMLSLMTPVLFVLFVVQQAGLLRTMDRRGSRLS